ncbi:adenylate/guanylate cyclase domain-containing protein [Variovorax sp. PCZ-1]|uniref:adenylate/guanylate cyclase domain-containing protein n=1 Tax=Variovorax sp. PCZ-1 TaxID=2835533 RepID=UPI001BD0C8A1|nr:adenylate/guanylate cyclase domain-containing protein [Variovorax sp. PCZ-1]MBS7807330.1 hypothetical protein [Variovorax sp. PCZ-1]
MTHNKSDTAISDSIPAESNSGWDIEALSPRQLRVVLVCDVVESVRWMEHDEDNAITRWSQFAAAVRSSIAPEHAGSVVKSTGDGLMLEFESAPQAVAAANAMQKLASEGNAGYESERQMHLRVGIHQAQVRRDAHDLYGHGVNLAARIVGLANPGEIVVTPEVRDGLTDGLDGSIEDMGDSYLKHFEQMQRTYRIHQTAHAPEIHPLKSQPLLSVAVIPFNAVTDIELSVSGDALADGLISHLSKAPELRVTSRLTANAVSHRRWPASKVAKTLGVAYIITTQCWALSGRLIVSHELIDATEDTVVFNRRYSLTFESLLNSDCTEILDMANDILSAMRETEVKRAKTQPLPSIDSAHALMAAVTLMHRTSRNDFQRAFSVLDYLQDRHPRHALLRAWMAKWFVLESEQGWSVDRNQSAMRAIECSRRALDLDQESSMALSIDGFVRCNLFKDFDTALVQYERALLANPSDCLAWLFKSMLHAFRGENKLSVPALTEALALSPLDPNRYFFDSLAASVHLSAANYGLAIEYAKQSIRANSTHVSTYRALTIAQIMAGYTNEARQTAAKLLQLDPNLTVSRYLERSPGVQFGIGRDFAYALREAGIPN